MKTFSSSPRFVPLWFVLLLSLALRVELCAQSTNPSSSVKPAETTPADFEKFSLHMQQQLQDARIAIQKEAQESARAQNEAAKAQVTAITDQLKRMESTLDDERTKREEQLRSSSQTMLLIAAGFGVVGLIAMLMTALFQWRTLSRMTEISQAQLQLPAPAHAALLPAGVGIPAKVVELSNQRLMSVIDRLERRVFELEHTAIKPLADAGVDSDTAGLELEGAARIPALLGKGQSLLNADKPDEALACYDEILKLDADHPEALVKKGAALERLKKDEEALRCYDRAIAADGTLTIAYLYKGGVFNRLERYNEALECYEQALRVQGGAA